MIRAFNGKMPKVADSAFVSERAYVVGDVEIGENSGIWPGAVIRADFGAVRIGNGSQVEDNSVIHTGAPIEIGDQVIIGHGAIVHCQKIGNNVLIGNNATILDYAEIGDNCIIAANSMVATDQKIPPNSLVAGVPAKIKRVSSPEEMEETRRRVSERYIRMQGANEILTYPKLVRKYKEEGL